ncbi:hypothetical protein RIF29_19324 [Crotalaria pallida]|uniref:Uncharacterized protein n=1 Tax=Crotalaria pallida TaxID=3830 RepID=A0AAN9F127_CROPI
MVCSDSVPLFGYRRRSYLVLSGLLGALSWTLMATFVDTKYGAAFCILLGSLSVAFSNVFQKSNPLEESNLKREGPAFLKGLDAFTSSLNHIGGTIGKSLEEGFTIVENRTSDIIQETRKHIRKKPGNSVGQNQEINHSTTLQQSQLRTQMSPMQTDQELQLKASRDVRTLKLDRAITVRGSSL